MNSTYFNGAYGVNSGCFYPKHNPRLDKEEIARYFDKNCELVPLGKREALVDIFTTKYTALGSTFVEDRLAGGCLQCMYLLIIPFIQIVVLLVVDVSC